MIDRHNVRIEAPNTAAFPATRLDASNFSFQATPHLKLRLSSTQNDNLCISNTNSTWYEVRFRKPCPVTSATQIDRRLVKMPPVNRKRRSEAISRDASASQSASPGPSQANKSTQRQRRQRSSSAESSAISVSSAASEAADTSTDNKRKALVKKLVRLALATEYSRISLRRTEISAKVFKDSAGEGTNTAGANAAGVSFKRVFDDAQTVLRQTFGMELRELPTKEKTGLNERRKQATQTTKTAGSATTSRSWILVSILPKAYKEDRRIVTPSHAPSEEAEAGHTGFCSFVVALVYLNNGEIAEQKLERYLQRVNASRDTGTEGGSWNNVKARMIKEGYLERKKDSLSGEDVISYVVGPRGKMEVGVKGVDGLVRSVYGLGVAGTGPDGTPKIEEEELAKRLKRSLGTHSEAVEDERDDAPDGSAVQSRNDTPQPPPATQTRKRGRPRAARNNDDD